MNRAADDLVGATADDHAERGVRVVHSTVEVDFVHTVSRLLDHVCERAAFLLPLVDRGPVPASDCVSEAI